MKLVKDKQGETCNMNATTSTVMKSVAVSKSLKFKSIGCPMNQPTTTQNGICIYQHHNINNLLVWLQYSAKKFHFFSF